MGRGFSFESFAGVLSVDRDTIYEWSNRHKDFSDALKRAKSKNLQWWETHMVNGVYDQYKVDKNTGKTIKFSLNTAVVQMNMRNRFGWTDKAAVEINNTGDIKRLVIEMPDDERKD